MRDGSFGSFAICMHFHMRLAVLAAALVLAAVSAECI